MSLSKFWKEAVAWRVGGGHANDHTVMGIGTTPITISSNYTLTQTDYVVRANATSAQLTITLPSLPIVGKRYVIKKIDNSVNAVTINGTSIPIDGSATAILSIQYQSISLFYDLGSNTWNVW